MPLKFHSRFSFRFIIQYVLARRHCTESTHGRSFNIHWNIQHFWDSSWTCPSVPCDRGKNRGEWRRGHNSDNWQFVGHLKVLSRWILAMATQSNQFGVDGCPKIHRLDEYWIELNIVELTKVVTNETRTSYMWFWKVRYFDTSSNSDGLVAVLWFLFNVHASRFAICPSWGFETSHPPTGLRGTFIAHFARVKRICQGVWRIDFLRWKKSLSGSQWSQLRRNQPHWSMHLVQFPHKKNSKITKTHMFS